MSVLFKNVTWGAEHELADISRHAVLPKGFGWDTRDITIVNSNGIANDPSGELYGFGGEINTPPTDSPEGQVECLCQIKELFPNAVVNYRSNLHIHLRVPGLKEDLVALKRVQKYVHKHMREALALIEPIPYPTAAEYPVSAELKGALRRYRRRCVSHHTLLTPSRLAYQLEAKTVEDFFNKEPPMSRVGKPLWHAQPRLCVSLRQLLQTDTVEFRHFPGTLDEGLLYNCLLWCGKFMHAALSGSTIDPLLAWAKKQSWPTFPKYVYKQEVCYRATVHDGSLTKDQIKKNIQAILEGRFDACVGGVPRQHKSIPTMRRASGGDLFNS